MSRKHYWAARSGLLLVALFLGAAVFWVLQGGTTASDSDWHARSRAARIFPDGSAQLTKVEPFPMLDGEMCEWMPASFSEFTPIGYAQNESVGSVPAGRVAEEVSLEPVRILRDSYPTYSAIAQDAQTGDIFMQDENLFGIRVFDRMTNTPANAAFSEPKRMLRGENTKLEFNCGLYIDPISGDIYSVNNDTTDMLVIFNRDREGNVPPDRTLKTPHGTYGIAVDEEAEIMYMTVQHTNSIVVFNKFAEGDEAPLRTIRGFKTMLADPHGISLDKKNGQLVVTNHGNILEKQMIGGEEVTYGKFEDPSISFFPMDAEGDVEPLRIIAGDKTRLNWPAHVWVDDNRGEIYVGNDADHSVLVFNSSDSGNVAPKRMIRGPLTQLRNPMGVFIDYKNDELWVSNMGNHRATVYDRTANGNMAPKRVIRSAPEGKIAQAIGNPGAVGYDTLRDEILVPN
jgi:DNA-binding beta-propeller fold protein YncE